MEDIRELTDHLAKLLGVDYVGYVTSTQLKIGRETLLVIIDKLEELGAENWLEITVQP